MANNIDPEEFIRVQQEYMEKSMELGEKELLARQGYQKNSNNIFETTRTVYPNKILTFLNWNVNYHVEHHLYPSVPFYNLGKLNSLVHKNKPEYSKERLSKFIKLLFIKNFFEVKN